MPYISTDSFRIGMASKNSKSTVDLFREYHPSELVRHRERRKRDFLLGAGAQLDGKTLGVAAKKLRFARSPVAQLAQPPRKLLRSKLFPCRLQHHYSCSRIDFELSQRRRPCVTQFQNFSFGVVFDPSSVIVD